MSITLKETSSRSAWLFLAFLTLLNVINFVDRQLITSLQIPLREDPELRLTTFQNQLLAGYAFSIVLTAQAALLAIPVFVVAFRRYESDLERLSREQEDRSLLQVEILR